MAVKRREEVIEQEEIEAGEINLIPYLDIVTNLMLFLLASVAGGAIVFGQLNTMLPDKAPAGSSSDKPPDTRPDEVPLKLVVQVLKDRITLWSVSGREGTLKEPVRFPYNPDNPTAGTPALGKIGQDTMPCDGGYMCESGFCNGDTKKCEPNPNPKQPRLPVFDYRMLNDALYKIAKKHYGNGVRRKTDTYQAVLMADDSTPYETLVSVMGAMRCKMPEVGKAEERCYLPTLASGLAPGTCGDEKLDENEACDDGDTDDNDGCSADCGVNHVDRIYVTDKTVFDPDKHALFPDILFSRGFE